MKFRKRHKKESTEVFTDSLNDILFIILMFFLIVATAGNPNIMKMATPRGSKDAKSKQNITVSIDKDQNFYVNKNKVTVEALDSVLSSEIRKQKRFVDTPTVAINADTIAHYGEVFRVIRIAGRDTAKVVAIVRQ
jgi:biopolymer transport protein ExbD